MKGFVFFSPSQQMASQHWKMQFHKLSSPGNSLIVTFAQMIVVGWPRPTAKHPHSLSILLDWGEKTGGTGARKLLGQDEGREITYQAPSWAKQPHPGEFNLVCCQLA